MRFAGDDLPGIDYRSAEDDAWFGVILLLIDDVLIVRYEGFSTDSDEVFPADSFDSLEEIDRFEARFRPATVQLQDFWCPRVTKGTEVCASHHFENNDLKFFDATVVEVQNAEHSHDADGEEACSCTFWILWRHGPLKGSKTSARIDNICVFSEDKRIHPALISFLEKARKYIANAPDKRGISGLDPTSSHGSPASEPIQLSNTHEPRIGAPIPEDGLLMSKPSGASGTSNKAPKEMKPLDEHASTPIDFYVEEWLRRRGRVAVRRTGGSFCSI